MRHNAYIISVSVCSFMSQIVICKPPIFDFYWQNGDEEYDDGESPLGIMMMVMTRTVNAKKMEGGEMQRNVEKWREI